MTESRQDRPTDTHSDAGTSSGADPGAGAPSETPAEAGAGPGSRGVAAFERVLGREPDLEKPMRGVRSLSYSHLFPEVWDRPGLPLRERSLVTVALLAAQGREGQLRAHLEGARSRGIPLEEVIEVMVQVAHYAGWPAGMFGQVTAESVYAEEGEEG